MLNTPLNIETSREIDDDVYLWEAIATQGNLRGVGHGYSEQTAIDRAKTNMRPVAPPANWENSVESFLARVSCREASEVCVDYSPFACV